MRNAPQIIGLLTACACLTTALPVSARVPATPANAALVAAARPGFLANAGQLDGPAVLYTRTPDCAAYFEPQGVLFDRPAREAGGRGIAVRISFPASAGQARLEATAPQAAQVSVLRGSDPSRWRTGLETYGEVRYHGIARGADLVYRLAEGRLKYDVELAAGSSPGRAVLRYEGAERLELDARGGLLIHTAAGTLYEQPPLLYQELEGVRVAVRGGYRIGSGCELSFWAAGYDERRPLVVDPAISWSTYLGGSGADCAYAVTTDAAGYVYVVGSTASSNYPVSAGAYQSTLRGGTDVFVTKLQGNGSVVMWSTLLGGSGNDAGRGVAVDGSGGVYVCGETSSADFPTTAGALRGQNPGGVSAFVTKLGSGGNTLLYSTYLGGSAADYAKGIAVDAAGCATVVGYTGATDFPTTAGVVRPSRSGSLYDTSDGFVTKLNAAGTGLVYSTYVGGSSADAFWALALDGGGGAVVCGNTQSTDFPATAGALRSSYGGMRDAVVVRLNAGATGYVYSTYLGSTGTEDATAVRLDAQGNAYVTGYTNSTDFPTTSGSYQRSFAGGGYDGFVVKLPAGGTPLVYGTYLGGAGNDAGYGIGVLGDGSAVVACVSAGAGFPTTAGAVLPAYQGGTTDGVLAQLSASGASLLYSTFLGSSGADQLTGIATTSDGTAVVAGYTNGASFPTTVGAYDVSASGTGVNDGILSAFSFGPQGTTDVPGLVMDTPAMSAPRPNPFRAETEVSLVLPREGALLVQVRDIQGRLVRTLVRSDAQAGVSRWRWDGRDEGGVRLSPGVYLIQVSGKGLNASRLATLLR